MKKVVLFVLMAMLLCVSIFCPKITKVYASDIVEGISAKSYVVIDNNGKVLLDYNSNDKREVASICKLMTTLLTLEKIEAGELKLEDKFLTSQYASSMEGSQAFLDAGSEYTVEDLLKSVIIASANDSAVVLAEGIGGSEKHFVSLMNARARELGMTSTIYANSTGLPAPEQYSTAYDTAILLDRLDDYELYHRYSAIWLDSLTHPSGRVTELVNTNRNIKYYEYCTMGKTGFTDEAGYCLASKNTKGDMTITVVVLGSNNSAGRFTDSMKLCNYTFANYTNERIITKGARVDNSVTVDRGKKSDIELEAKDDYYVTRKVGTGGEYSIKYDLPSNIEAKVSKGDKVGEVLVLEDSKVIASVDIISSEDIDRETYKDILNKVMDNFDLTSKLVD